ncbi:MAG: peptidylprolyl isomerase [Flavobacteriales bacterium]|nr:peptidylprolyl isomerase [Flavobacteriales bacterium]
MSRFIVLAFIAVSTLQLQAQKDYQVLDEIIAVVGNEIILLSDLETQKAQLLSSGQNIQGDLDCQVLEALLYENLLLHQAKVDSVDVSADRVESELDRRINMFSQQLGSAEKLEEFYGKSIAEIRNEFYEAIEQQLMVQTMQQNIVADITVTPADVEEFYNSIPEDSIPLIESEVEVSQILIKPKPSEAAIKKVKDQLEGFRSDALGGRDFATMAILYSEDPGSSPKGGELGLAGRGQMVSEFEQVAYNLDEGEISHVFKSDFGYHLMEMIERKGDFYNARHILLKPKLTSNDLQKAKEKLEEVKSLIMSDSLTFAEAALKYSDDEGTRNNNGIIINPNSGSIRFPMNELDPQIFLVIDKMDVGEISEPSIMRSLQGDQAYRIVKLRFRSEAHKANLVEDYQLLQEMTRNSFTDTAVENWLTGSIDKTSIRIDDELGECDFSQNWNKIR